MGRKYSTGFTIVELLIVVVVIAILAAVTIVSFHGVTNRAKDSSAQSVAAQAAKKLVAFSALNADSYPDDITSSDIGLVSSATTSYEYRVSTDKKSFCLTTIKDSISYYVSDTSPTPTKGVCIGHSSTGRKPVTNLAVNPSVEVNANYYSGSAGTGGAITGARVVADTPFGQSFYRQIWTTSPTALAGVYVQYAGTGANTVEANKAYTVRATVRSSWATATTLRIIWWNTTNNEISRVSSAPAQLAPGQWTDMTVSGVAPGGVARIRVVFDNTGTLPPVNGALDVDGVLITEGDDLFGYSDGSYSKWQWDGTPHTSTSKVAP